MFSTLCMLCSSQSTMGPKCMLLTCHSSKASWPLWFILHYWQIQKIWLLRTHQAFKNWSKFPVTPLYGVFLFDKKTFQVLSYRLEKDMIGHGVRVGKHSCHKDNYLLQLMATGTHMCHYSTLGYLLVKHTFLLWQATPYAHTHTHTTCTHTN